MQLANRFQPSRKMRMWVDCPFCAICGSNNNCSVHHIYGCKAPYTNSLCNSIMLCEECHRKADTHNTHECGNGFRIGYLFIALNRFVKAGLVFLDVDKLFLKSIWEDVQVVTRKH